MNSINLIGKGPYSFLRRSSLGTAFVVWLGVAINAYAQSALVAPTGQNGTATVGTPWSPSVAAYGSGQGICWFFYPTAVAGGPSSNWVNTSWTPSAANAGKTYTFALAQWGNNANFSGTPTSATISGYLNVNVAMAGGNSPTLYTVTVVAAKAALVAPTGQNGTATVGTPWSPSVAAYGSGQGICWFFYPTAVAGGPSSNWVNTSWTPTAADAGKTYTFALAQWGNNANFSGTPSSATISGYPYVNVAMAGGNSPTLYTVTVAAAKAALVAPTGQNGTATVGTPWSPSLAAYGSGQGICWFFYPTAVAGGPSSNWVNTSWTPTAADAGKTYTFALAQWGNNANFSGTPTSATISGYPNVNVAITGGNNPTTYTVTVAAIQAAQTVNFPNPGTRTYGDAPFSLSATASSGLPVSFAVASGLATISGSTLTITGAGTITVQASQAGNSTYSSAPSINQFFTVNKANQTISFGTLPNKTPSSPAFTVSATANSGLPVTFSVLYGPAAVSGSTVTLAGSAGTVAIRASQAGNANYNAATNVDQNFTVTAAGTDPSVGANLSVVASQPGVQVVAGDFDGDGKSDIALLGGTGWSRVIVAFSKGDGTFNVTNARNDFLAGNAASGCKIASGDFNGDGKADIALIGGPNWNTVVVGFSNGDGTFSVTNFQNDFLASNATSGCKVLVGDFNGDGKADIALIGGPNWNTVVVGFSNGDGTFRVTNFQNDFLASNATSGCKVLVGDFDGDGKADIVLIGGSNWNTVVVGFSNGDGTFRVTNFQNDFLAGNATSGCKILAGDFNGDHKADIVLIGGPGWNTVPLATSNGDGTFSITAVSNSFLASNASTDCKILSGDFNGDHRTDVILLGNPSWNTIPVGFSSGDGSFSITNCQVLNPGFQILVDINMLSGPESIQIINNNGPSWRCEGVWCLGLNGTITTLNGANAATNWPALLGKLALNDDGTQKTVITEDIYQDYLRLNGQPCAFDDTTSLRFSPQAAMAYYERSRDPKDPILLNQSTLLPDEINTAFSSFDRNVPIVVHTRAYSQADTYSATIPDNPDDPDSPVHTYDFTEPKDVRNALSNAACQGVVLEINPAPSYTSDGQDFKLLVQYTLDKGKKCYLLLPPGADRINYLDDIQAVMSYFADSGRLRDPNLYIVLAQYGRKNTPNGDGTFTVYNDPGFIPSGNGQSVQETLAWLKTYRDLLTSHYQPP